MATFTKTAALLVLALTAGGVFAAAKPTTQTISTLGGKFTFTLPKAYTADTLPAGKAEDGTAATQGTMYANQTTKSVVIVAETLPHETVVASPAKAARKPAAPHQSDLFASLPHPVLDELAKLDLDDLTPRKALEMLYALKTRI